MFARDGALWAVPFDPETLQTSGQEVVVLRSLEMSSNDAPAFAYSDDGLMVYLPGYAGAEGRVRLARRRLVWVDQTGREEPPSLPVGHYASPRLSPDGERLAVGAFDGEALRAAAKVMAVDIEISRQSVLDVFGRCWKTTPTIVEAAVPNTTQLRMVGCS